MAQKDRFFTSTHRTNPATYPAKNAIFEPFIYINDHFAKTGSGQT
jgi:hypothetical protein